jgi:glycosyltransferase involved in cell wall biosynthesis
VGLQDVNGKGTARPQAPVDIVMAGAFPPPVRGMPLVTVAVRDRLVAAGAAPRCIDISSGSQRRDWRARARRFPKIVAGLARLCVMRLGRYRRFYISLSAGYGQVYDTLFLLIARARRMEIFAHHHSYAYLRSVRPLTCVLVRVAGPDARHAVQSRAMGKALGRLYGARNVFVFSNAVFLDDPAPEPRQRTSIHTVGLLSNLSVDKGVWDFVGFMEAAAAEGLDVRGRLAGPFDNPAIERRVRECLGRLPNVIYDGPLYGAEKSRFFDDIDVFLFPTRYDNETEGLVNLEALRAGVPVIAYGRGCIPEIVDDGCGLIVPPAADFVAVALSQVCTWRANADEFLRCSQGACSQFRGILAVGVQEWRPFLDLLAMQVAGDTLPHAVPADWP